MKRFAFYLLILTLSLLSLNGLGSAEFKKDPQTLSQQASPMMMADHECCEDDSFAQPDQCCESSCDNCDGDCNNSSSALLASYSNNTPVLSPPFLPESVNQTTSTRKRHLRPPIA